MNTGSFHKFYGRLKPLFYALLFLSCCVRGSAQFAPVVGYPGTTAIRWDSSAFVGWATGCTIHRGPMCIATPDSGDASIGDSSSALGPATQNGVVSLGDGGVAILTFASPIIDGPGFDFAVFENGFNTGPPGFAFLELAFVEVSSDGERYVRFPAISNVQDTQQLGLDPMDGSLLNDLAGKYIYSYGTPFDLDELSDSPGIDVSNIRYVKVIDVVGSIDSTYCTRDSRGRIINDPYPTDYAACGFDLDAVGVIHQAGVSGISRTDDNTVIHVYPDPFADELRVSTVGTGFSQVWIRDLSGRVVASSSFQQNTKLCLPELPSGAYDIEVTNAQTVYSKLIVKE